MRPFLLLLILLTASIHAEILQPSDRARLVNVSEAQLSPDGKSAVVVVSRANVKDNRFEPELVLVDIASGSQRSLTSERRGLAQPRWSPDGARLAFLANAGEKRQLWVMPMSGGDARRLTDAANGVQQFAWSPDGARLAYVTADEPAKKSEADRHNRSFEIFDDDFLITSTVLPSHIWLASVEGGDAKRLTSGTWSVPVARPPGPPPSPINWSPDGRQIAFARMDTPSSGNSDTARVALVDVASGTVRTLATAEMQQSQPVLSPDGRSVAYMHAHRGERGSENRVWIVAAEGGAGRELGTLDRNLMRAIWMPDGKSLLVGGHDQTTTGLWLQPLDGGPARRLDLGDLEPVAPFWIDASVGRNGAMVFIAQTPTRPRELYYLESTSAKPRRLTSFNDYLASRELGRAERIAFSSDGFDLDGVLITPPRFDRTRKYPLVLHIHGGPRASSTTAFSWTPQLLAAQDWVVFMPNYRGSDNLGNRVTRAILMDAGAGPGRDVMAGIEAVKKLGFVDDRRMAVGGWSYGGMMTSWMVGHYPVFKAAVSGAAVNSFLESYNLGDFNRQRRFTWGSPYVGDNMKRYIEQSPITYAGNIRTPMLILTNTGDARVPFTESFAMFRALRDNDVPVRFIAYPISGHNADDPVHQMDLDRRWIDWFRTYLE